MLDEIRESIDGVDEVIMEALHQRFRLVETMAEHKISLVDEEREKEILAKAPSKLVADVYQAIFEASKDLLREKGLS